MKANRIRLLAASVAALAVTVGAGAALAASGEKDLSQVAAAITARSDFESAVAGNLGKTAAEVDAAIEAAAGKRIDDALASGEITAAEAETLRTALADGHLGMRIAQAADVASELGVTEAQLDDAYSAAHKAEALARVDAAVAANQITASYAAELKAQIADADFPGFGEGMGRHGGGPGFGGPGLGGGRVGLPVLAPAALA